MAIDLVAMRAKYEIERNKRLRPDANKQWVEVVDRFAGFNHDPHGDPSFRRLPVMEEVEVVIVGGGYGGLLSATRLRQVGIDSFRIIEKAADFGGTWYWNRYPGAQCDIESYIYLPLLEETGYTPSEKYTHGPEMLEHARRIGRTFDLYPAALFQTHVIEMRWLEEVRRWRVTTDRGDILSARYVMSSSGPLNRPRLPGIPGLSLFKGHGFHTSRWDYEYTGGGPTGGMTGLRDKRVAVIGTGATAIQCVPYLAEDAGHLFVVQRTPSTVGPRGNAPTDPEWVRSLKPGWQQERVDNFAVLLDGGDQDRDLVRDGWTHLAQSLRPAAGLLSSGTPEEIALAVEAADYALGDAVRGRVDDEVADPDTAAALKAWYYMTCKRPTFNDGFLPAFNKPNVTLVDTKGRGVDEVTENAIVVDGRSYEVDCIIYATGFEVGTSYTRRSEFEIVGVGGKTLGDHFANGMRTLHGFFSHGFPNFFILGLSQNGFKPNFVDLVDEQIKHIVWVIGQVKKRGCERVEADLDAEAAWVQTIVDKSRPTRAFLARCTPGYYGGEGDTESGLWVNKYGDGAIAFSQLLREWREKATLDGLTLS